MLKEINKKIIVGLAILGLIFPLISFAARTDSLWDYPNGSTYLKPIGSPAGNDILLFGSNHYLNWGAVSGTNGYGIRDNAGSMEFKNSGGSWAGLGSGGGGTLTTLTAGTGINFSSGATCTITCTINATGGTNFFTNLNASTSLTTGSLLEAGNFAATSTTATSTFAGPASFSNTSTGLSFYNTADQVTNYEKVINGWLGNVFTIGYLFGGSGSVREIRIGESNTAGNTGVSRYLSIGGSTGATTGYFNFINNTASAIPLLSTSLTSSASSGVATGIAIPLSLAQTGTAGYNGLNIVATETTLGSGTHNLIQAGTSTASSLFTVDNQGTTTQNGYIVLAGTVPAAGRSQIFNTTTNTGIRINGGSSVELNVAASTLLSVSSNIISTRANAAIQPFSAGTGTIGSPTFPYASGYFSTSVGIGTTSPFTALGVAGTVVADNFKATSTSLASTFPYASTTALSISSLGTPAGSFLAVDPTGLVIATTSPTGTNYFTLTGNNLQNNSGNALGINTAPNLAALEVQGTTSDATANALAVWNSSAASVLIAKNNGNVGIGTTTPADLLDVASTLPRIYLTDTNAGTNLKHWFLENNNGSFRIATSSDSLSVTNTPGMVITSAGKMGVGVTIPLAQFHVNSLAETLYTDPGNTGNASLLFTAGGSGVLTDRMMAFGVHSAIAGGDAAYSYIQCVKPGTANCNVLLNAVSGNVGIGTSSPAQQLTVSGTVNNTNTATEQNNASISIRNPNVNINTQSTIDFGHTNTVGTEMMFAKVGDVATSLTSGAESGDLEFGTVNAGTFTEKVRLIANGNFGINDTTPDFKLESVGSNSNGYFGLTNTTDGDIFKVSTTGFVGIGTTSPWRVLSVVGSSDLGNSALAGFFTATSSTHSTFAGQIDAAAGVSASFYQGSSGAFTSFPNTAALTSSAATFNGGNGVGFTPRASMINDGRFGIGSTSPQSMLSIVNNLQVATGTPSIWVASTTSAAPATHFVLDSVGHQWTGGATPVCSTNCATVAGDDNTMVVTASSGIGGNLVVNFSSPWKSPTTGLLRSPSCMVNEAGGATLLVAASTTPTSLTLTATSIGTNPLYIICSGSVNFTQ